jgi:hypothetical protein
MTKRVVIVRITPLALQSKVSIYIPMRNQTTSSETHVKQA